MARVARKCTKCGAVDMRRTWASNEEAALEDALRGLDEVSEAVARAALLAAGYRRHHRGEWRKRRAREDQAGQSG